MRQPRKLLQQGSDASTADRTARDESIAAEV